jgi:hypothetical protein
MMVFPKPAKEVISIGFRQPKIASPVHKEMINFEDQ